MNEKVELVLKGMLRTEIGRARLVELLSTKEYTAKDIEKEVRSVEHYGERYGKWAREVLTKAQAR
jgi:hypothetical protein